MTASADNSERATQPVEAERSQPSFPSRSSMGDETNKSLTGSAVSAAGLTNIGRRIRDYELLELLGQGGMGSVWKAKHTRLKRMVALKLLPLERMSDAAAVARFHREMEAVGQLRHPHIIEALDAGEEAGTHYLVMEFVEGIELAALSKQVGPFPIADACELMRQTALGLQHAFEHGLVHRDIKPSNLLLAHSSPVAPRQDSRTSPDVVRANDSQPPSEPQRASGFPVAERQGYFEAPHIKILDLGLALLQGDVATGSDLTSTGQVMGTLDYIAPEQLADTHAVDIRADLYSLGCTLYRLLTGEPPFSSATLNTAAKKIFAHSFTPPPSLLARRPDAPPELAALVNRLLAKKPEERFATPNEVAAALAPFCVGHDLVALLGASRTPLAPYRGEGPGVRGDALASTVVPEGKVAIIAPRDEPSPNDAQSHASSPTKTNPTNEPQRASHVHSPGSSRGAMTATLNATSPRRRFLIALAGVASLALAGIVFKTSARRGSPDPAASPDRRSPTNSTTTNTEGDLRSQPSAGSGDPRTAQTADPDRAAAEWVLAQKTAEFAQVSIQVIGQPGPAKKILRGEPLPDEPFHVTQIAIFRTNITDHDLAKYLPRLARITRLSLGHCTGITDASVPTLCEIGSLRSLDVAGTSLSPPACMELMQTLALEIVNFSARHLTPKVIDLVCVTPRIKQVSITASASNPQVGTVTDEQLKALFRAKQLARLDLFDVTADMATWREFPDNMPNLTELLIQGKHFTDAHLTEFARLPKLKFLALQNTAITDAGLPALYDSRALRNLDLPGIVVTDEAVRALHDHIPLCRITHPGGVIEPKAARPADPVAERQGDKDDWPGWAKELREPPPLEEWLQGRKVLTVKQDGSAMFQTIQAALDKVQPGEVIRVLDKGPYRERLVSIKHPGNFGLVSDVNTVIELITWELNRATKREWLGHLIEHSRDVRVSGFTFVCKMPETMPELSPRPTLILIYINETSSLCVEDCVVLAPQTEDDPLSNLSIDCSVTIRPMNELCVRRNVFGPAVGFSTFQKTPYNAIINECLFAKRYPSGAQLGINFENGQHRVVVHRNHFAGVEPDHAISFGMEKGTVGDDYFLLSGNTFLSSPNGMTLIGLYGSIGSDVTMRDNLLSASTRGFHFGTTEAKAVAANAREEWIVRNNWGGERSPLPDWVPLTDASHTGELPYLSVDPEHPNFLRLDPAKLDLDPETARRLSERSRNREISDGRGTDSRTASEISRFRLHDGTPIPGALPPGPPPPGGDWFTRLQSRLKEAQAASRSQYK